MEITACPKCGSRNIHQGTIGDGVLIGYSATRYVCRNCGFQGMPIVFDSKKDYQTFLKNVAGKTKIKSENKKEKYRDNEDKKSTGKMPNILIFLTTLTLLSGAIMIYVFYRSSSQNVTNNLIQIYYLAVFVISAIILPYGFITAKRWAYTLAGVLYVLSLPVGLFYLYLLTRPPVKNYFGNQK